MCASTQLSMYELSYTFEYTCTCTYTCICVMQDLAVSRGRKVQLKEAEGFASTYYNIPSTIVQRVTVQHDGKVSKIW